MPVNGGEQIQTRTQERDAMFGRMASMTMRQPNELTAAMKLPFSEGPLLGSVERTAPSLVGLEDHRGIIRPAPGDVLRATGRTQTAEVIVDVLRTFTNIGAAGVTPGHQWRAAEHFRPFYAVDALVEAVEKLIDERVRLSARVSAGPEGDDAAGASFP